MTEKLCNQCPRRCGIDRDLSFGFCGTGNKIRIARAALHHWEEPCISGSRGSGAVFFCGCNLKCVFCQNSEISRGSAGKEISTARLGEIFTELQNLGAHNINLVTPTHYTRQIRKAIDSVRGDINIPIVYNCGGYESKDSLSLSADYVSVYLTDMKYFSDELSLSYSRCKDYLITAAAALEFMIKSVGTPKYDSDGIMQRGVIVRHLVLPSHRHDSIRLINYLKDNFGTDKFRLSLMSQFTPNGKLNDYPELNRRVTSFEYNSVTDTAYDLGFRDAYVQQRSSAKSEYTPPFDLTGV